MKKLLIYLVIATGVLFSLSSCSKNNLVVDKDILPPSFAKFNTSALIGTYYVSSTGATYKLPIGMTTVSSKDRIVNFTYTSSTGAASGVQYTAPASVTIPAGKTIDTLRISGLYSGYPLSTRIDSLKVAISGGDVPKSDYNNTYTVLLRKYCDVVLASLEGNYTRTFEGTYGPYTTVIRNLTSTGPTSATGYIKYMYDYDWSDLQVLLDWSDPANFKVTVPEQATNTADAGSKYVRTAAGKTNTFSSCDQTFTITLDLMDASKTVKTAGYQFKLSR